MPRIFMSVLARGAVVAFGGNRRPPRGLAALLPFGQPGERRQDDEVQESDHHRAEDVGESGGDAQKALPQPVSARAPDLPAVRAWGDTRELRVAVIHMKDFIAENFFEDLTRGGIV